MNWKNLILATFLICTNLIAQNPTFDWVSNNAGTSDKYSKRIKVDTLGNVYTIGAFQGVVDFDAGPGTYTLASNGSNDVYITKHNSSGNLIWAISFGGTGNESAFGLSVSKGGDLFAVGSFQNMVDFDPGPGTSTLTATSISNGYILKLNLNGSFIWVNQFDAIPNDVFLTNDDRLLLAGAFTGTVDFDPGIGTSTLTSTASYDGFILKLDTSCNFVWVKSFEGNTYERVNSVVADSNGDIYSIGVFSGTIDLDPGPTISSYTGLGGNDVFITKLNSNGSFIWGNHIGGTGSEDGVSITLDQNECPYLTGGYSNLVDFDPGPSTYTLNPGSIHMFILKLSKSGNFNWVKSVQAREVSEITTDMSDGVYTTGYFENTVDFDPGPGTNTITSQGVYDLFILKLDSLGNFKWVKVFGGPLHVLSGGICTDLLGNVFTTGQFRGNVDFDPDVTTFTINAVGSMYDTFTHKMLQCITPLSALSITQVSNQLICIGNTATLSATAPTGTLSWYATPSSTTALGTGTAFVTPTLSIGTYTYYVEVETCTTSISRTAITLTVSACTGMSQMNIPESLIVSVYPNPSSGEFFVNTQTPFEYEVIDLQGKIMKTGNFNSGANVLGLNNFSSGMYFLKCLGNKSTKPIKLVVN